MRLAYLVTEYPTVSHTFVRREVHALESLGASVLRVAVRRQPGLALKDPLDVREEARTRVLLDGGKQALLRALAVESTTRPATFRKALEAATRMGLRSERGLPYHVAYLAEACLLRRWLEEERIQHLHAHFGTNSAMVALLCRLLGGPPFSFTAHGPDEFDKPALIHLREKIHAAKFAVGVSSFGKSQLCRWAAKEDWSKIEVVRCGLDASYLALAATPVPDVSQFVSVGRLSEQKGQIVLVRAVAQLAKRRPGVRLLLVGDGPMRGDIEEVIRRERVEANITITGYLAGPDVQSAILGSRALVMPSFAEGLPVAIMEAFALARPVVSTYIAGIPELVVPGKTGWLVPAGDEAALVPVLEEVLDAPAARLSEFAARGRDAVHRDHDIMKSAARLLELFREAPPR